MDLIFFQKRESCPRGRRGSFIVTVLVMTVIIGLFIAALMTFSSYRAQAATSEWKLIKAQSMAEAGLACAISELHEDHDFQTHKVNADSSLSWGGQMVPSPPLRIKNGGPPTLTVQYDSAKNSVKGTLGDGEFKFRCGLVPAIDDSHTSLDERKIFFKVESIGLFSDSVRRVKAIIQQNANGTTTSTIAFSPKIVNWDEGKAELADFSAY